MTDRRTDRQTDRNGLAIACTKLKQNKPIEQKKYEKLSYALSLCRYSGDDSKH